MPVPRFELTAHAATVVDERAIDIGWIARVLATPERTETDKADQSLTHAIARIPERDDRMLRVVYNASVEPIRVITVYFDRRQRGKS